MDRYYLACFQSTIHPYPSCVRCTDPGHFFGKETQKVVVPSVCRRRRRSMGTMVRRILHFSFDLDSTIFPTHPNRIVNAELRQPKSDRGTPPRIRPVSFVLTPRLHSDVYRTTFLTSATHRPSRIQRHPRRHPHQSPSCHAHPYLV